MKHYKLPPKVKIDAKGVGCPKNITAQLNFYDGCRLKVVSERDRKYRPTRLDSIVLIEDGKIKARLAGIKNPGPRRKTYDMEFLGSDGMDMRELAEYWNSAISLAENRMDKYLKGRIDDATWRMPEYSGFCFLVTKYFWARYVAEAGMAYRRRPATLETSKDDMEAYFDIISLKEMMPDASI